MKWRARIQDPRRKHGTAIRARVETEIRNFFLQRDFLETRTPLLVPCPGMEPHVRPISTSTGASLPTSPEFAMKRLLVGGLKKIFQICPSFRDEPRSPHHFPEFTMLEWYRAHAGYEEIMRDTENLVAHLARSCLGKEEVTFQGRTISVKAPWPRYTVRELFLEHAQVDLGRATATEQLRTECLRLGLEVGQSDGKTWDDYSFLIWLNCVEPRLPNDRAIIVHQYPASQAALAVLETDPQGHPWARRFEIYAGGLELGNAFEELTDPIEQRRRFDEDMELRERTYGSSFPRTPLDEGFLEALEEGLPPSSGIAVGVDRLVMLIADEPDIDFTVWISPHTGKG